MKNIMFILALVAMFVAGFSGTALAQETVSESNAFVEFLTVTVPEFFKNDVANFFAVDVAKFLTVTIPDFITIQLPDFLKDIGSGLVDSIRDLFNMEDSTEEALRKDFTNKFTSL